MAFGLGATIFAGVHKQAEPVHADVGTYYSGISDSLTGDSLKSALNQLNNQKRTSTVGYNGMKTFASVCDADPDGSGKIIGFYDNAKLGPSWDSAATWNREHVWPNARGGSSVEDDAHMVRPASVSTNSGRGSKGFGEQSFDPGTSVAYYRGVASRIIFYCAIANTNLKIEDIVLNSDGSSPANTMGTLSDMLKWNLQYLPTDTSFTGANDLARRTELSRNEKIQTASGGQGNRNPFIDHPEYACKIWGNTNNSTKAICGGTVSTDGVSISESSTTIAVNGTTTLSATSTDSSTITWSSDKTNVVTVSKSSANSGESITLTGVSAGSATITAKATINSTLYSATCSVTVTSGSQQSGDYSIVFNTGSDGSNEIDSNSALNYTTTNTLVDNFSSMTKCYQGASGLKLGSSKATGSFTAVTKTAAKTNVKSVTVTSAKYGTDTGTLSLSLNGTSVKTGITPGEDYTYTYTNPTTVNNFTISTSSKRAYVGSVSFTIQSSTTKTLSSIAVKTAPTKITYTAGETFDPTGLVIEATYSDASKENITYSSSNSSQFTFSPSTNTALATTNTSVTITYGGKSCSQAITVNAAATPTVSSVSVSPTTLNLIVNGTGNLSATVNGTNNPAQTVTWTSGNTGVATVDSDGKVTGVSAGTATITATSTVDTSKKGTCTVTVTNASSSTKYDKVTSSSDLTSGQYLIVCEDQSVAFNGGLTSLDAVSNTISVSVSSNQIEKTSTTSAAEFTIDTSAGTVLSASGYYIGRSDDTNGLTTSTSEAFANAISLDGADANIVSSGGAYLRYNATEGQTRFRYYKSTSYANQTAIQLYKLSGSVAKTLSSISVSNPQTNYTTGDAFVKPTVTATFSDSSSADVTNAASFEGFDLTVAGNYTVTVSYTYGSTTKTTTYSITVAQGSTPVSTYEQVTGTLSAGDKVVIVAQANRNSTSGYAMTNTIISSYYFDKVDATISNQKLNYTSGMAVWTVGGSASTGYTFYSESAGQYFYGYGSTSGTKTYRNIGLSDTAGDGSSWTVAANAAGTGYDVHTSYNSIDIYLEYYTSKSDFSGYYQSATDVVINFYKETSTSTNPALEYAQNFLAAFTCDATGTNAPTFASGKSWATLKTAFSSLSTPHQNTLKNATANQSGTDIEKAVARYDYVVAKYGYENFMNRTISNQANKMNPFNSSSTNNLFMVLGSISLLGGLTYLAYFLKKRKED